MKEKKMNDAKRLLQLVQIGRRDLSLDEEDYRALLEGVTGQRSAKGLKAAQLEAVLTAMKGIGFKPKAKSPAKGRQMSPPSHARVKAPEVRKLRAIWITMAQDGFVRDGSEDALASYAKRITTTHNNGAGVASLEWLTSAQASRVLESLKKWHVRLMTDAIIERGDPVPDTLSYRHDAKPGYDLIRDAYENPGKRPPRIMVTDGSKTIRELQQKES
jgi:phage gp16-like protein